MDYQANILFIVADDLNSWIAPLGRHPGAWTPAIDALSVRGTVFTNAYCAAPYCNASRMSVFTACLPTTTGIYRDEVYWDRARRRRTALEALRNSGYYCHGAGKVFHGVFDYGVGRGMIASIPWREIQNRPHLWDVFATFKIDPMPPGRPLNKMFDFEKFDSIAPWYRHFDWGVLPDSRESDMPDRAVVDSVVQFLEGSPPEPFFCAAGLYKPHLPWFVPQRFFDLHPYEGVTLPFVKTDDLDDVPDIAKTWALSPPDHEAVTRHGQWRHAVRAYLAAISYCDSLIGELIEALDRSPARDRTVVVLWGDNGFHLGEKLHWRKFVLWEEATCVPLIIVPANQDSIVPRVYDPVSLVDIFPTLFEFCGLEPQNGVDGISLVPLIKGQTAERGAPVVTTWLEGNHSVRFGHWRYTRYQDGTEELYDHLSDPYEWNNLAGCARYAEQLGRSRECIASLLMRTDVE